MVFFENRNIKSVLDRNGGSIFVYHGSYMAIPDPRHDIGNEKNDFGKAFYVTNDKAYARQRAVSSSKRWGDPTMNTYRFRYAEASSQLNVQTQVYWSPTEEWAEFVLNNRRYGFKSGWDIVIGPISDLNFLRTVQGYDLGRIPYDDLLKSLDDTIAGTEDTMQIAFCSKKALGFLDYLGR